MVRLNDVLRLAIDGSKISQSEIAERLGVSVSYISKLKSEQIPGDDLLERLGNQLSVKSGEVATWLKLAAEARKQRRQASRDRKLSEAARVQEHTQESQQEISRPRQIALHMLDVLGYAPSSDTPPISKDLIDFFGRQRRGLERHAVLMRFVHKSVGLVALSDIAFLLDAFASIAPENLHHYLGLVVSNQEFEEKAKKRAERVGVECLTLRALMTRVGVLDHYQKALIDKTTGVPCYQPLGYYTGADPTDAQLDSDSRIVEWLNSSSRRLLIVKGNLGSGKTTLAEHVACRCLNDWYNGRGRLPVLLNARDYRTMRELDSVIGNFLQRYGIGISPALLHAMNAQGLLCIIIDGLDEMLERPDREEIEAELNAIYDRLARPLQAKLIITCRSEYFSLTESASLDLDDALNLVFGARQVPADSHTLLGFTPEQIATVLTCAESPYSREEGQAILCRLNADKSMHEIATRPLYLGFWQDIYQTHGTLPQSSADVFFGVVDRYVKRERSEKQRNILAKKKPYLDILKSLGFQREWEFLRGHDRPLLLKDVRRIIYRELPTLTNGRIDALLNELIVGYFLKREGKGYRFTEEAFRRFFYALLLHDDLLNGRPLQWEKLPLYNHSLTFVVELIKDHSQREACIRQLWTWLKSTVYRVADDFLGRNCLAVLAACGEDFSGRDLRGINASCDLRGFDLKRFPDGGKELRTLDLGGAKLNGTDLRGADLTNLILCGVDVRGAEIDKATRLEGVVLDGSTTTSKSWRTQSEANTARPRAPVDVPQYMVLIPEGNCESASEETAPCGFFIDRFLITNEFFSQFVHKRPEFQRSKFVHAHLDGSGGYRYYLADWTGDTEFKLPKARHPVVWVPYDVAKAFADWRTEEVRCSNDGGKQFDLPTTDEWAAAARAGVSSSAIYPWGDEGARDRANFESEGTTPVDAYPPSPARIFDLVGNVWEWTKTLRSREGKKQVDVEKAVTVCGGSYRSRESEIGCDSTASLQEGNTNPDQGFRCVMRIREGHKQSE